MFRLIDGKNPRTVSFQVLGLGAIDCPSRTSVFIEKRLLASLSKIGMPRTTGNAHAHAWFVQRRVAPLAASLARQRGQTNRSTRPLLSFAEESGSSGFATPSGLGFTSEASCKATDPTNPRKRRSAR